MQFTNANELTGRGSDHSSVRHELRELVVHVGAIVVISAPDEGNQIALASYF